MNNWLAGFIDAKGCFRIIIESNYNDNNDIQL
jgi:hypothetical protein